MSDEEALSKLEDLHNHVVTQTAQTFVTSFLSRCLRAHTEHTTRTDLNSVPVLNTTLPSPSPPARFRRHALAPRHVSRCTPRAVRAPRRSGGAPE
ncbi:hypothetical protein EDB19DRAFT_2031824 [Suillus lakei]|nr:hypothetical protein EDB19DRAFT_2031824 [Suillus lakei]